MTCFKTLWEFWGTEGSGSRGRFDRSGRFGATDASGAVEGSGGGGPLRSDLLFLFVLLASFKVADSHLPPILQLDNGLTEVVFVLEVHRERLEVLVVHHTGEAFGFAMQVTFFFGAFLVQVIVASVLQEFVLEYCLLSVSTRGEACVVDIHDEEFQFHFRIELASPGIDAIARIELHGLDCLFGFVVVLDLEF